jgi:hypothetical protein
MCSSSSDPREQQPRQKGSNIGVPPQPADPL